MSEIGAIREVVERLSRVAGVQGALVADAVDGVPVDTEAMLHVEGDAVAALAVQLFRRASRSSEMARFTPLRSLQLEAEGGDVFVAGAGELVVVAVLGPDANVGLVRLEVLRAADELA